MLKTQRPAEYLAMVREMRAKELARVAELYAAEIKPNIRAAIAKVSGVENIRLDKLSAADRRKMNIETRKLVIALGAAQNLLSKVDFTDAAKA